MIVHAVYKILFCRSLLQCTLHFLHFTAGYNILYTALHCSILITYPDGVYKVATAAILILTRGLQSVFSLENDVILLSGSIHMENRKESSRQNFHPKAKVSTQLFFCGQMLNTCPIWGILSKSKSILTSHSSV